MQTEVIKLDPGNFDPERLRRAAAILRTGGLVALPTETVYGLGAV
jgi:L-threonylcarbamoyladenylate synthase